ncbi:MAG: PaaI family thioesterase [Sneathiellaceae bacterium]
MSSPSVDDPFRQAPALPVPPGFRRLRAFCAYATANGPLYGRIEADGGFTMGCRLTPDHDNLAGMVHGGWLMSLADMAIGFACSTASAENRSKFLPTISLQAEFLAPGRAGQWAEARATVLQSGRRIAFAECLVACDGEPVLRASGTFKVPSAADAPFAIDELLLPA